MRTKLRHRLDAFARRMRVGGNVGAGEQKVLQRLYARAVALGEPLTPFADAGFRELSGTDEDGLLLFLFAVLGCRARTLLDIGCRTPAGSNSANLILHHGWSGLLIDGDKNSVDTTRRFYESVPGVRSAPPTSACAIVTADNVNELIARHGMTGEIDLLSIDIDGMDYWIWKAIDVVSPRVVVVEYQRVLGAESAVTVPYDESFRRDAWAVNAGPTDILYAGASLRGFDILARSRGYTLVGCNWQNFNAFYVRDDVLAGKLPAAAVEQCFDHPVTQALIAERRAEVEKLPWEAVDVS